MNMIAARNAVADAVRALWAGDPAAPLVNPCLTYRRELKEAPPVPTLDIWPGTLTWDDADRISLDVRVSVNVTLLRALASPDDPAAEALVDRMEALTQFLKSCRAVGLWTVDGVDHAPTLYSRDKIREGWFQGNLLATLRGRVKK